MRIPLARLLPALLLPMLLLAGCAAGDSKSADNFDFTTCGVRPRVEIPVDLTRDVPTVQATINGGHAVFVLDTGAESVTLTAASVKRLDLKSDERQLVTVHGTGGASRFFPARLHDFTLSGLPIPDHEVPVLPRALPDTGRGPPDGLLGVTILSNFEMDLDLPHGRMTLYAGHLCPQTVVPVWPGPYSTLDAEKSLRGRFIVPVELDGRTLMALIDTGTQKTIVSTEAVLAGGLTQQVLDHDPATSLRGSGPDMAAARVHRFDTLRIGDDTFHGVPLIVAARQVADVDVILGMDYLRRHRLWLSYARRRVFIARSDGQVVAAR